MTGKKITLEKIGNSDQSDQEKAARDRCNKRRRNKYKKRTPAQIAEYRENRKVKQQKYRSRNREDYNTYKGALQNKPVINPVYGKLSKNLVAQISKRDQDLIKKETIKCQRYTRLKTKYNKLLQKIPNDPLYQRITILFDRKRIYVDSMNAVPNENPVMSASSSSASQQSVSGTISDDNNSVLSSETISTVSILCRNSVFNSNNRFLPLPDPTILYPSCLLDRDSSLNDEEKENIRAAFAVSSLRYCNG